MKHGNQAKYDQAYGEFFPMVPAMASKLDAKDIANTIKRVAEMGGADGVQALFDATLDNGHRAVLVQALNAPSLPEWVREKLNVVLYGGSRQMPALLFKLH